MKWKQKLNSVKQQYHYIIMNVPPLAVKYYKQVGAFYSGSPITNSPTTHTRTVPVLSKKVYPLPLRSVDSSRLCISVGVERIKRL